MPDADFRYILLGCLAIALAVAAAAPLVAAAADKAAVIRRLQRVAAGGAVKSIDAALVLNCSIFCSCN